jgi:hydroxymethylglutaryl-CoA lyase
MKIEIHEVGVRDGLQNEKTILTTETKLELIQRLVEAGAKKIEVASFVNPKVVPQMADAETLVAQLPEVEGVQYSGLVLSRSGLERFLQTKLTNMQLSFAVSDGFNLKNILRTTEESIEEMLAIVATALAHKKYVNLILGTAFGCPYDGEVAIERVLSVADQFISAGVHEITLADTIGVAHPVAITQTVEQFHTQFGAFPLGLHLHNTRGRGLANAYAGLLAGVTRFDSSIGGIGGCPFAPKAVGNICTEDFVSMIHASGYTTDLAIGSYVKVAKWLEEKLGHEIAGMLMKTE